MLRGGVLVDNERATKRATRRTRQRLAPTAGWGTDTLPDGWLAATLLTRIASPQPEERWKPDDRSGALIRPVTLFGTNVKERTVETGEPRSTIYDHANFFDAAGMASLLLVFPESEVS